MDGIVANVSKLSRTEKRCVPFATWKKIIIAVLMWNEKKTRGYDKAINFVLKKLCVLFGGKNLCFHFNGTNVKRKINGLNPQITRKCGWFSILTPNEWVHSKWK